MMPVDGLEPLFAERAIRQQLHAGCRALDRLDLPLLRSLWYEEGTLEDQSLGSSGAIADQAALVIDQLRPFQCHAHHLSNVEIQVEGDRAVSRCELSAVRRSPAMVDSHYRAEYRDQWSRREGRWAIERRQVLGGTAWTLSVADAGRGERSRRDRADPVYPLFAWLDNQGEEAGRKPVRDPQRVEVLMAEREILRQLNHYCRGLDRFDIDLWKSVWHDDATLDYESGHLKGRALDMAAQMTVGHEVYAGHSHQIMNPTIRIKGDRAVSETCAHAVLRGYADPSGTVTDSHYRGRYLDRWSRRDGRWAIDHRTLTEELMWNQPADEPWSGPESRRDRQDPSFALFASVEGDGGHLVEQIWAERAIGAQLHAIGRADRHQIGTMLIRVSGNQAVSETGVIIRRPGEAGANGVAIDDHVRGRHLDRWSKREGHWALDDRHFVEDFGWRQTVEPGATLS